MESKPEIFFSYAWGDESEQGMNREKIVNDLYESLKADGFNVVRDKNDLRYKGLISNLTSRIGRGKFIVVAISDKYLKSTYCMSELLEIYRRSNSDMDEMLQKIFPIVLEDVKIYNPEDRVDYLSYWEDKKEELNKELKEIDLENVGTFADDLRMYDEITSVMPILSQLLRDINTLNLQKLSANNFAEIKSAIIKTASASPAQVEKENITKQNAVSGIKKLPGWKAIAVALILITVVVVFLHLSHVSQTKIRMELSVSEINFTLPQQQVVTNIMKLASIGASGLENIQVPVFTNQAGFNVGDSSSAVLLSLDTTNNRAGSLSVDALSLPAGMRIGIQKTDVTGEYRFSFHQKALNLPVQADGFVKMIMPPNAPQVLNFASPGAVHLQSVADGMDLDIIFSQSYRQVFSNSIAADSVSLFRINENFDEESSIVRTVSTISSGSMFFESLGGKKRLVSPGELIHFKNSNGTISVLELLEDHVTLTFVGNVSGMTSGDSKDQVNLMPTYLEWLKSRVGIPLLFVIVLVVLAVVFGVRRLRQISSTSR